MRIDGLETIRLAERPNLLWLRVLTDEGVAGLGETFFEAGAVEAHLHEWIAPRVIGRDPLAVDALSRDLVGHLGFRSTGAEARGNPAFDIALWDLWGRATDQPVAQLLGGFTRGSIRAYDTCAGPGHIKDASGQAVASWGLGQEAPEDLDAAIHRPDELARSLLAEGITAMKIWPFDDDAERTGGHHIDAAELRAALRPFEAIRAAVGDAMDLIGGVPLAMAAPARPADRARPRALRHLLARGPDPHGLARGPAPLRRGLHGAPLRARDARLALGLPRPAGNGGGGRRDAGPVLVRGLSEARKAAAMAEARHLPVAPHDCTGPAVWTASTHLSLNAPNALVREGVRAFYRGWYRDVVTALPEVRDGHVSVPPGPGLGLDLHPDLDSRFTATRRTTTAGDI